MAPVIFANIKILSWPVSEKHFGANKTWRGIIFAIVIATAVAWIQLLIYPASFKNIALNPLAIGAMLGFAAIFGDLFKSFFKRRLNIPPGQPFLFFDQADWIILSLIFIHYFLIPLEMGNVIIILIIFILLHLMTNWLAFKMNIRDKAL
jgi:CDP-2,3-bis-(O-geranylgeranyl)-sn-glycerol synthase